MIYYEIKKIDDKEKKIVNDFYSTHCSAHNISSYSDKLAYVVYVKDVDKIIGLVPILKLTNKTDKGIIFDNHYNYLYVVIHTDYRSQGYCNGLLRMATKLLIEMGVKRIRCSKSSLNDVKHTIFTDMGFDLLEYNPKEPEFKHTYELDVDKVINMWSQYE